MSTAQRPPQAHSDQPEPAHSHRSAHGPGVTRRSPRNRALTNAEQTAVTTLYDRPQHTSTGPQRDQAPSCCRHSRFWSPKTLDPDIMIALRVSESLTAPALLPTGSPLHTWQTAPRRIEARYPRPQSPKPAASHCSLESD
eukprot:3936200-Rhodomonas_salina.1